MESITSIVIAIASGAAAGLRSGADQAIKDGYSSLKGLIARKYRTVDLGCVPALSMPTDC